MPRAHRYFLPNRVWHITHCCHEKAFLLKFARDRERWRHWLFEARKRFGLCVLNYVVTSNHIHLLVRDQGEGEIASSMQLVAGRTAQEFNQRKGRKGAFWEDRYHATAVDTEEYLARCMAYIDLNMVRAGAVKHPGEWPNGGYREIQDPPARYAVIDRGALLDVLGFRDLGQLQQACREWVEEALRSPHQIRNGLWSESLAVGQPEFVESIQAALGVRGVHRESVETENAQMLKEPAVAYEGFFGSRMARLTGDNTVFVE
jgi:putative transposase